MTRESDSCNVGEKVLTRGVEKFRRHDRTPVRYNCHLCTVDSLHSSFFLQPYPNGFYDHVHVAGNIYKSRNQNFQN